MKLSPHWPSQHTKLGILWLGLNINLCHPHATADSQAHSRVFCGEFGTNLAKYFKPEGFYYCKPAGLLWPICSCIQIDLTEFHQGKVIEEISLFLHLCVAVLSGPVDWHWLWGIDVFLFLMFNIGQFLQEQLDWPDKIQLFWCIFGAHYSILAQWLAKWYNSMKFNILHVRITWTTLR